VSHYLLKFTQIGRKYSVNKPVKEGNGINFENKEQNPLIKQQMPGMKKLLLLTPIFFLCSGFFSVGTYRYVNNDSFTTGEELQFRIHWGFLSAGEATVEIGNSLYKINDRPCFRVNVFGQTTGLAASIIKVRNTYRSFIDTAAIIPHQFYVNIQEGKYRKEENVFFDQRQHVVKSEEKDDKKIIQYPAKHSGHCQRLLLSPHY